VRILGIDPGSRTTGWGVLDSAGWDVRFVAHGVVKLRESDPLHERLRSLAEGLRAVLAEQRPDVVAVEAIFHAKSARSALILGHARGIALLAAAEALLPLHEYPPASVKSAVAGNGRAEKEQVQRALAMQLGMRELPMPLDASDALAVALCHAAEARFRDRLPALPPEIAAALGSKGRRRRHVASRATRPRPPPRPRAVWRASSCATTRRRCACRSCAPSPASGTTSPRSRTASRR
jgi:crossover junction endodeoxyribonuclease RuvC